MYAAATVSSPAPRSGPTRAQSIGIWLVGGYFVLNSGAGVALLFLIAAGVIPVPAETLSTLNSLPPLLMFIAFVTLVINLVGGGLLILRRRAALPALFGGALGSILGRFLTPAFDASVMPQSLFLISSIVSVAVLFAALAWVASLARRGVLEA